MGLKIDIYCNDGSPLGVNPSLIYTRGVGGAELALMSWAETMQSRGHTINMFNNGFGNNVSSSWTDEVMYHPQVAFDPNDDRDIFIAFRSVNPYLTTVKANMKIFWSCDQRTTGDYKNEIFPYVDRIVCISPFHVNYHKKTYGPIEDERIGYFDLGVKLEDYENQNVEKVPGRCIYCSVPDRGLDQLLDMWPEIKKRVPHASLVITSDYTLWGNPTPANERHKLAWAGQPDVQFVGNIPRGQLVKEQLKAVCQPYPCIYDELFCIASAECQVAGAYPVTTNKGALQTTNMASVVNDRTMFLDEIELVLNGSEELLHNDDVVATAKLRFDWDVICRKWERLFETGEFS